jgi:hypothetical protein
MISMPSALTPALPGSTVIRERIPIDNYRCRLLAVLLMIQFSGDERTSGSLFNLPVAGVIQGRGDEAAKQGMGGHGLGFEFRMELAP